MIRLEKFSCGYDEHSVISSVNLEIMPGKITAILGKNGSGKSTLAQVLAGLKLDFRGQVWLDDLRLKRSMPIRTLRQKIGLVLQNPDHQILFNTVQDEIDFVLCNFEPFKNIRTSKFNHERYEIIQAVLKRVGLESKINANTQELSGGQKQRLALASALVLYPKYLILDEVTSMLDLSGRHTIYQILKKLRDEGTGIIMITNQQEEILLADTVLILDDNKIHSYEPIDLIKNNQLLNRHGLETSLLLQVIQGMNMKDLKELRGRL